MTIDQPTLFPPPGRPGAMSAPVATLGPLTSKSSLSSAATSFQGYMLRQGFSENTVKAFMGDLRLYMKYASPNTNISRVSTHDLENFLTWMLTERNTPCSPKSYARRLTTLKVFFKA